MELRNVPPEAIDITSYQIRDGLNEAVVERYAEVLEAARDRAPHELWPFPGVSVNLVGSSRYVCIDGAHRIAAAIRVGWHRVQANVETITEDEAKTRAAVANTANGLPLTSDERKRAILRLLTLHPTWGDSELAGMMKVHRNTVARIRKESGMGSKTERTAEAVAKAQEAAPEATHDEIAAQVGVAPTTVAHLPTRKKVQTPRPTASPDFEGDRPTPGDGGQYTHGFPSPPETGAEVLEAFRDELGQDIPAARKGEWDAERDYVAAWSRQLTTLKAAIKRAAEDGSLRAFSAPARKMDDVLADIDALRRALLDRRPEALCRCNGEGCRVCDGRGFLTLKQYQTLIPEDERFVKTVK